MSGLGVVLARPLGLVAFDGVWVDDRKRCTWGLCDATFLLEPGTVTALVAPDQGAPETVFDLLTGRRAPLRGHVSIDAVDVRDLDALSHLAALTMEVLVDEGERRLTVAGRTTLVTHPTPTTLETADRVLRFDGGFLVPERQPEPAL